MKAALSLIALALSACGGGGGGGGSAMPMMAAPVAVEAGSGIGDIALDQQVTNGVLRIVLLRDHVQETGKHTVSEFVDH